ncbi:toll/interleukin-1 receptor domain-containing protein [Phytohabitans houttuyneae]|uniref:TIR domain-containing protein n=1 Tax=Phytohabitans houttuyneae TaxID=1076126 RepID=A0A6V8KLI9_9ACTN|nr:toll/interleukin-1 receptor domain-containing protein [Phytohabitans houttuyneae]GFJ84724.1 hypothetical protein Phou_089040 [Phytohabitans houttuyneae]
MTQPTNTPGRLYISHAPDGRAYARKLAEYLQRVGIATEVDNDGLPAPNMEKLRKRVDRSVGLLVLVTKESATSDQVGHELDRAMEMGRPIFVLLLHGKRLPLLLNQCPYEVARWSRMPSAAFVSQLYQALGGSSTSQIALIEPAAQRRAAAPLLVLSALAAVLLVIGGGYWIGSRPRGETVSPPTPTVTTAPVVSENPAPPDTVTITSPQEGAVVHRCERVRGTANLPDNKTMLFARNRTGPPDAVWYFNYVGTYQNGFVPPEWAGTVYFGSATRQSYDLVIVVMEVKAAARFWQQHKSEDNSYAFANDLPAGAERAALVRVRQGTMDDCE